MTKLRDEAYFRANSKIDANGCWIWQGAKVLKSRYGKFRHRGKDFLAHRASYEYFNGPIPEGHQVRHSCHIRPCINPEHLRTGTGLDNMADWKAVNKAKAELFCLAVRGDI